MDNKESENKKYSWWDKRTKIEKCLVVWIACSAIIIIFLTSHLLMKFPSNDGTQENICMTAKCIGSAASILQNMDQRVDPCEDFYKFACGNFVKNSIIPGDKGSVDSLTSIRDKVNLQLMKIFDEPVDNNDPKFLKLLKMNYKSCMNTTRIEKEGLNFVKKYFKELGGWPVTETGYWNEKTFDWKNVMYRLRRIGWRYNFFFNLHIYTDYKNSSRKVLSINQPCMAIERTRKGLNESAVKAEYEYLVNLATLFGADRLAATTEMKEVIEFKISIAKIAIPYSSRKNVTLEHNPMTIRALQKKFPSIPWLQYINNYLSPIDMFTSDDVVNVVIPTFLKDLEDLLLKTKKRILANYMFSRLVRDVVDYLPEIFRNKELEYYRGVYGTYRATPRWKSCVYDTKSMQRIAVSSLYAKKFFDIRLKKKVSEIVTDIKSSFIETLKNVGWMDRKTKKYALQKAENINSFIAYPDELLDDAKIEQFYEGLELNSSEYHLENVFKYWSFNHMRRIMWLRQSVAESRWTYLSPSYVMNAFYYPTENAIELPAAYLQGSLFDLDRPQYMNYGAIGEAIGHEITHGFDTRGSQFGKDGDVISWWEPETNRTFFRKSQCFVEQYGNYTAPEVEMNLDGLKTLGENIADNGGLKVAYKGYLKWLERNGAEPSLPGLPYTSRQMFWISSANNWCVVYRKETLKEIITQDEHPPNNFRVIVPMKNSDYFGKDFGCPLGSPMNPKYKCRVW